MGQSEARNNGDVKLLEQSAGGKFKLQQRKAYIHTRSRIFEISDPPKSELSGFDEP
jgi:hypothetical protein